MIIRQLKWVMQRTERFERTETLISISTDGSVLEWTTKKGFAVSTLMQLKRTGMVSALYEILLSVVLPYLQH